MNEVRDVRSLVDAAEQAAGAGDYTSAEQHLRAAAALQEAELGPLHPDLANTLNNLGVVSERTGNDDAAEDAYRRAYDIARQVFDPDHPFVGTSAANLRDFCEARGRPFEPRLTGPAAASDEAPVAQREIDRPPEAEIPQPTLDAAESPVAARRFGPSAIAMFAGLGAAALVIVWLVAGRSPDPARDTASTSSRETVPAPAAPVAADAPHPPKPDTVVPDSAPSIPEARSQPVAPNPKRRPDPEPVASPVTVVRAAVCRDFSTAAGGDGDWRCTPIGGSAPAGRLAFYTRVRSPQATTIEHRWYYGTALLQRVKLRVGASSDAGYRTFSRNTVSAERVGEWRVELRDASGALVHEERFVVR